MLYNFVGHIKPKKHFPLVEQRVILFGNSTPKPYFLWSYHIFLLQLKKNTKYFTITTCRSPVQIGKHGSCLRHRAQSGKSVTQIKTPKLSHWYKLGTWYTGGHMGVVARPSVPSGGDLKKWTIPAVGPWPNGITQTLSGLFDAPKRMNEVGWGFAVWSRAKDEEIVFLRRELRSTQFHRIFWFTLTF